MTSFSKYSIVAARVLMSLVFLVNGLAIVDQSMAVRELVEKGASPGIASVLVLFGRGLEVVGGLSLALGILPKYSAVCLLTFLVPATLIGHAFWSAADAQVLQIQVINFFKNVSIAAGLVFMASIENQPGLKAPAGLFKGAFKRKASV